jgi:hypothetical protein
MAPIHANQRHRGLDAYGSLDFECQLLQTLPVFPLMSLAYRLLHALHESVLSL